jgi:hypothetical protein
MDESHPPAKLVQRVFISFPAREAKDALAYAREVLQPSLERAGLEVFMVKPGTKLTNWQQVITVAAAHSSVFVAVISKQYLYHRLCMSELDLALNGMLGQPRDRTPEVIPVFFNIGAPCEGDVRWQKVMSRWQGQEQSNQLNAVRWERNLKRLAELAQQKRVVQLHDGADIAAATRTAVQLAVVGMHKHEAMAYDRQVANLAASAAVPAEGKDGVVLLGAGKCHL